jgi:hypothetical protein
MQRIKTLLVLLGVWALLNGSTTSTVSAQEFNSQLMMPNGISIEAAGNVNIHSDGIATTLLTKFAPDGSQLIQISLGHGSIDAQRFKNSRIATDPLVDRLYLLSPEGDFVVLTASTLEEIGRFHMQDLMVDTSDVYDVAIQDLSSAFIFSPLTTYGDIAAFRPDDDVNAPAWFVTGFSEGTAFVMRIPMQEVVTQASVILMSTVASPPTLNRPRGVAVNAQGVGLTTLPLPAAIGDCPDAVIRFSATAPLLSQEDVFDLAASAGVPSWGMDADANGFFLTTGGVGNADCLQGGHGSLVFIADALTGIEPDHIIPLSAFPASLPGDVAVSPVPAGLIYMTIPNFNTVVRFPMSILPLALPLP